MTLVGYLMQNLRTVLPLISSSPSVLLSRISLVVILLLIKAKSPGFSGASSASTAYLPPKLETFEPYDRSADVLPLLAGACRIRLYLLKKPLAKESRSRRNLLEEFVPKK